jgi:hypothetical protein
MAERKKVEARWSRIKRVLKTSAVAEKGQLACLDTGDSGLVVPAAVSTTLIPIGYFEESFTGDGSRRISIKLFTEIDVHLFTASATGAPLDADVGKVVYLRATPEVSTTATSSSVAGRLWAVTTEGCWVQPLTAGGAAS